MPEESKFVKTKIVAGYLLLVAAALLAVGYVYRETVRVAAPDGSYALLHLKRNMVGETLYHLYRAESCAQLAIAGYSSYDARYGSEIDSVRRCLDSLRRLSPDADSLQRLRLDSIEHLIAEKVLRTTNLCRSIRSAGSAALLDANVERLLARLDSLSAEASLTQPPVRSVISQDTVATPRRKRRFFRRIADIFSPPKEDSTLVISRREVIDSLPSAESMRDTIGSVLRTLQSTVTSQRLAYNDRAWNEGLRLRASNELVDEKVYRLIRDFEQEETAYLLGRIERDEALRKRTTRQLGAIASAAVALMLLFVAILWRDINRSNRYKRALEQANRDKAALLDARQKLMLAVTHDIKAPLGAIMGYTELLERLTRGERERHYLENITRSSEHLLALTRSLLDFYRLDIHKMELNTVPFIPERLFEAIRAGFAAQAAAKGLTLTLRTGEGCRCEVTGDASRIRQVADNLLSNAVKFTDTGGVELEVACGGGRLRFSVRDTGRGIGAGERERIFREFERSSSARGVEGFGLGLSIVERLVRLLGGEITLESSPGKGSCFTVTLPVGERTAGPRDSLPERKEECAGADGATLLVVDDDPLQLELTEAQCRQAGIRAVSCSRPERAAQMAAEGRFDVVLTDIQMPGTDGFGVRAEVERAVPGLPVIAVTARSETDELLEAGFAAALRKPFTRAELCATLAAVLHRTGPDRETEPDGAEERPDAEELPAGDSPKRSEAGQPGTGTSPKQSDRQQTEAERTGAKQPEEAGAGEPGEAGAGAERKRTAKPGPEEPGDSIEPGEPSDSTEPGESGDSIESGEPGKPIETDGAGDSTEPTGSDGPVERPDFGRLTAFAGDDPEAAHAILRSFVEQHTASVETLRRALACGDRATLRATAHRMLPLFTMLDARSVTTPLRRAERLEGPLTPQFRAEMERTCEKARQILVFAQKEVSLSRERTSGEEGDSAPFKMDR